MKAQLHSQGGAGAADRTAETRARILDAALEIFSAHGLAGARTEQIAAAAGFNKALLYYYFESKEKLYLAAVEMVAARVRDSAMAVLLKKASAGERVLRMALNHFDRILTQQQFQCLMQQEMMRLDQGTEGALPVLVERVFAPIHNAFQTTVKEGIQSDELIEGDWMQFALTALGANVFYFLSAPVWRLIAQFDPLDREVLRGRRSAMVEFLAAAVFRDRKRGARLAARVLADTPMPEGEFAGLGRHGAPRCALPGVRVEAAGRGRWAAGQGEARPEPASRSNQRVEVRSK